MYKLTFIDGELFIGGNPENSLWNNIPNKSIKSLECWNDQFSFKLENYEAYNHIVEHTFNINTSTVKITRLIIMGKNKNIVFKIILNLIRPHFLMQNSNYGEEYNNKPTSGWKVGIKNGCPFYLRIK